MKKKPVSVKLYAAALFVVIFSSCARDKAGVWQDLFNGQDLTGWEIKDGHSEVMVENGIIRAEQTDTANFPYLVSTEIFSDFILELDVKLTGTLNSGILIRGISDPLQNNGKIHGFQMEIDQTERKWTGGIYEEAGRKWLTPLEGIPEAMRAYRNSEWNHYRIEAIRDTFKIWVNDVPTTYLIDGKTSQGIIGFQIHKRATNIEIGTLRLKNIRIITEEPESYSKPISFPLVKITPAR